MKHLTLGAAALLALAAATVPSAACDPEMISEQMTELCRSPLDMLSHGIADLASRHDVSTLKAELERARFACSDGRYEDGLAVAVALGRQIGRLEGASARPS